MREASFGVIPLKRQGGVWFVLMICHRGGHWSFPKGHPEPDETPQETAARELKEETGLSITQWLEIAPFSESYSFKHQGALIHKTVTYFAAEAEGTLVVDHTELSDAEWVPLETAERLASYPEAKTICKTLAKTLVK